MTVLAASCTLFLVVGALMASTAQAQRRSDISCSATEQFTGTPSDTPRAAPLRGSVGCVDIDVLDKRQLPVFQRQDAVNIYGPMEAGFTGAGPQTSCLGDNVVPGGIDTNTAEHMVDYFCPGETVQILDGCGGHAVPYHYHERMTCLYDPDPATLHSTRIGTAGDGNGIYGRFIDGGVEPTDLDACGGRFGVTPDSNGEVVYYYPVTSSAPFSLGCYGPVDSVEECRALYPGVCGRNAEVVSVTTEYGTGQYTLDCPCYDSEQSNVIGQGRPGFLEPLAVESTVVPTSPVPDTAAPSTASPSTASPSTASPSTASPSTASPSTAAPSTAAPSTAAPSTAAPSIAGATATPTTAPVAVTTKTPTISPTTAPLAATSVPTYPVETPLQLFLIDLEDPVASRTILSDGMVVPAGSYTVEATVPASSTVHSVKFGLDGNQSFRTENVAPYVMCGDSGGNYFSCGSQFAGGATYTISATAFSQNGAGGSLVGSRSVAVTIAN